MIAKDNQIFKSASLKEINTTCILIYCFDILFKLDILHIMPYVLKHVITTTEI